MVYLVNLFYLVAHQLIRSLGLLKESFPQRQIRCYRGSFRRLATWDLTAGFAKGTVLPGKESQQIHRRQSPNHLFRRAKATMKYGARCRFFFYPFYLKKSLTQIYAGNLFLENLRSSACPAVRLSFGGILQSVSDCGTICAYLR